MIQSLIDRHFPPSTHPYRVFQRRIEALIAPGITALEIGCGRKAPILTSLVGTAERLIGIDVVPFAIQDPRIELHQCSAAMMTPIQDGSVDLVFSRSVMEHVDDADAVYAEIRRVLSPGGTYVFLTPNFWDYGSLVAYCVPNSLHGRIVRATEGRLEEDVFPTHYRSNTRSAITQLAVAHGLKICEFDYLGQYPNYLRFNIMLFRLGCYYEKFLARFRILHPLRGWILCSLKKL